MTDPWLLGYAIGMYSIALLVVAMTYRRLGFYWASVPLMFAVYFLISESMAIASHNYQYGPLPFPIDLAGILPLVAESQAAFGNPACNQTSLGVPLSVVLMEGLLVFGVLRTTDYLAPPQWLRPLMDGLMVMTIDLILDPVAANSFWCGQGGIPGESLHAGLGLWTWFTHEANPGQWFGIPLNNFSAWFFGPVAISASVRIVAAKMKVETLDIWQQIISAIGALVLVISLGLVAEFASFWVMGDLLDGPGVTDAQRWGILLGVLGAVALAIVSVSSSFKHDARFHWEILVLPGFLFVYMGMALLWAGPWNDLVPLLEVWIACAVAFFTYARAPYLKAAWKRRFGSEKEVT